VSDPAHRSRLSLIALSCALVLVAACRSEPTVPPRFWDLHQTLAATSLRADEPFRSIELGNAGGPVSQHLVVCRDAIQAHFHASHDETVLLLRGSGDLQLGSEHVMLSPGVLVHIPAGTVHAFRSTGTEPAAALSCFSPAFDGKDRIFVNPRPAGSD
jgi:mannose-6-phosphate isomerase-like protein (cupin superfamily)